ncbi:MAG: aminotransferase class V-fold PLP-dependent enzyme [Bryobacterales bacterium]|nr:aminotransferase class V-fold PLP-dependent enzyme [Bryobacterales bacterium]
MGTASTPTVSRPARQRPLTRRALFRNSGLLAAAGLTPAGTAATNSAGKLSLGSDLYESIGVRPVINATGPITRYGGSIILPEVREAMAQASKRYVEIDELMEAVGKRLAEITGAEAAMVTSGCAAALTHATSACIAGGNPERIRRLPSQAGLKDEVVAPVTSRNGYDHAIRMLGIKMIEVANEKELRDAIGPRTAMVSVLARAADQSETLGLSRISRVAREYGVPVLVDAAAEDLTIPNVHLERGADLLAYSGGKALHGPQSTGLLIGRKDLIHAARLNSAPHGSFGRPMKVAKEDIMGLLAAVEMWPQRDHAAEWRTWQGWAEEISASVRRVPGVQTKVQRSAGLPQSDPLTALKWERKPRVEIIWDSEQLGIGGEEVFKHLYNDEPRIILRSGTGTRRQGGESHLLVVPSFMQRGDANVVAERLYRVLSNPPRPEQSKSTGLQANVAGRWELKIDFVYGSADHTLTFAQEGGDLSGEHRGEITTGDLAGWVDGNRIHFRDTHTYEAATFGYEFEGEVAGDTMQGDVGLGAYGSARWTARRRPYA